MPFVNWRYDTFEDLFYPVELTEYHTIKFHPDWNAYGIQLDEVPFLENPSTIIIREDITGGDYFNEIPRSQPPSAGEFRVDYGTGTFFGTGRINFNSADNLKKVEVIYFGLGSIVKNRYYLDQETIATNLYVQGVITGDRVLDWANDFNPLDLALDKEFFDSDGEWKSYTDDGTDGKRSLEIIAHGTDVISEYKVGGLETFFKIPENFTQNILIHLEKNVLYIAGDISINIRCYDKDKSSIGTKTGIIPYSQIEESYKWHLVTIEGLQANTVFVKVNIQLPSTALAGRIYIDFIFGGNMQIPIDIITDIMRSSTGLHYKPSNQKGITKKIFLDTAQLIIVSSTGALNYLITDSDIYYDSIISVILSVRTIGKGEFLQAWKGNSGNVAMNNFSFISGIFYALNQNITLDNIVELPISYFAGGQAGLRLSAFTAINPIEVRVRGFNLG